MTLSTHVLDTAAGVPAAGLRVTLSRRSADGWAQMAQSTTDQRGRITAPFGDELRPGEYELLFEAGEYFARNGVRSLYVDIPVRFTMEIDGHYHVPLLLSPFGYSTYRGS